MKLKKVYHFMTVSTVLYGSYLREYFIYTTIIVHDTAVSDSEPTYTEVSGGHDVVESTYAVVYANTGPSDVPMYDPLIVPTLPISLDDFKYHVTNCHLNDDEKFSDKYQVIIS